MEILFIAVIVGLGWYFSRKKKGDVPAQSDQFFQTGIDEVMDSAASLMEEKRSKMEAKGIAFVPNNLSEGVFQLVDFPYSDFEAWYTVFKQAALESNPTLGIQGTGYTLIDMMEDEPSKRAYQHHLDPKLLGKRFGEVYDPAKMGYAE